MIGLGGSLEAENILSKDREVLLEELDDDELDLLLDDFLLLDDELLDLDPLLLDLLLDFYSPAWVCECSEGDFMDLPIDKPNSLTETSGTYS